MLSCVCAHVHVCGVIRGGEREKGRAVRAHLGLGVAAGQQSDQHIVRLQVPVHNLVGVEVPHARRDLQGDVQATDDAGQGSGAQLGGVPGVEDLHRRGNGGHGKGE